jgi:proteasome assembly chaperone (PAC2) family protein
MVEEMIVIELLPGVGEVTDLLRDGLVDTDAIPQEDINFQAKDILSN